MGHASSQLGQVLREAELCSIWGTRQNIAGLIIPECQLSTDGHSVVGRGGRGTPVEMGEVSSQHVKVCVESTWST